MISEAAVLFPEGRSSNRDSKLLVSCCECEEGRPRQQKTGSMADSVRGVA